MPTAPSIQDDPALANRYLAGQLSPTELQAYEQHLLEDPDAVRELEATARMKVGLANIRDAGQLDSLLREAPPHLRRTVIAFAAAAALAVIAVGLWRGIDTPADAMLVAKAGELIDRSGRPLATGSTYALLRTRGSTRPLLGTSSFAYDAVIELPAEPRAIELRVRPETPAPAYSVALSQIHSDASVVQIGNVSELKAEADGFVRLYVDSSRLESGPYLVVITPGPDRTAASTSAFRIKVTDPASQP
jgi:hypothetical protein